MYPQPDLTLLALRKHALMHRIRARRSECGEQVHIVMKPVVWIDGLYAKWSAISPIAKFVAVPAGVFVGCKLMPRLGRLLRWTPVAMNLVRFFR